MKEVAQVMGWKGKTSPEDREGYRSFSMTQASYRQLAMIILLLLEQETDGYLPQSQVGGRKERSTMDALLNIRLTIERVMAGGAALGEKTFRICTSQMAMHVI